MTAEQKKPKSHTGWIVAAGLATVVGVLLLIALGVTHTAQAPSPLQQLTAQRRTLELINTAFTVKNLGYVSNQFSLPSGATNVSVTGHFSASGGLGNDIEVFLLSSDGFVNFQNGHQAATYYNSGRVTQNSINANLPPGAATYYLVFNNNFSLLSAKAVQASVTLNYTE